jgi:MFS family permease
MCDRLYTRVVAERDIEPVAASPRVGGGETRAVPGRRITRTLLLVGFTSLLTDLSSEMIYPLLPMLVVGSLGASATLLGVIEGIAESLPAILKVCFGRISDRSGRRKPLAVAGCAASACGKLLLASATGAAGVFAGRVVDRIGKGVRGAPRDALIADASHHAHRGHAYGFHKSMDTLGAALGALSAYLILVSIPSSGVAGDMGTPGGGGDGGGGAEGGWVAGAPLRAVLWCAVIPAVLAVLVLLTVRDSARSAAIAAPQDPGVVPPRAEEAVASSGSSGSTGAAHAGRASNGRRVSLRRTWIEMPHRLRAFMVISFVFALGGSSNVFLLLRAQELLQSQHLGPIRSAATVCLLYLVYNLTYAAASFPFGTLSDRIGRRPVLVAGYALYAVVYGAFALNSSPDWCWALFAVYGLFPALTEGVEKAFISDLAPFERRATLLGLHGTLLALGLLPASIIGGLLWDHVAPEATFWMGAALGLAAAVGMTLLPRGPSSR